MTYRTMLLAVVVGTVALSGSLRQSASNAAKPEEEFASTTIDLGVVVSDVERSAKFYVEALGFREVKGFSVPGDFAADAGLTNGAPLTVRIFVLGEGASATKLKLMQIPQAPGKKSDNAFIHSQLGFRYLTLFVKDTNAALARLKKAGVTPIARGTLPLPKGLPEGVFLTNVRDPDGNLIELVGPKK